MKYKRTLYSLLVAVSFLFGASSITANADNAESSVASSTSETTLSRANQDSIQGSLATQNDQSDSNAVAGSEVPPENVGKWEGGDGLDWSLQSRAHYNNLSIKQFELQLGGQYEEAGDPFTLGSRLVKDGLSGHYWYTVSRYTATNADTVYVKVVARIYGNSSRSNLIDTATDQFSA
jgi:hypothetical protein